MRASARATNSQPTHALLSDSGLPATEVCAEYSLEAANNAGRLRDVAGAAAELNELGVALLVLALEEAVKTDLLTMRWKMALRHPGLDYLVKNPDVVTKRDHSVRHLVAARQLYSNELYRLHAGGMRDDAVELAARAVAAQVDWLRKADQLKQRGLYVDPLQRSTPSTIVRADYDAAVAIVGPYVTASMHHAGSLARPADAAAGGFRRPTT
jgi:AbiV family abortive infection protein